MVLILIFSMMTTSCASKEPNNYTATMVVMGMEMEMVRLGDWTRTENPMMKGVTTLTLPDQEKMIVMSSETKSYYEESLPPETSSVYDPRNIWDKKTKVGKEKIDGHPCVKYDATFHLKHHPDKTYQAMIWEATDLNNLVIKSEMAMPEAAGPHGGKMVMEMKNIRLDTADRSMFNVPTNYEKVGSMMEVMGMGSMDPSNMQKSMEEIKKMMEKMKDKQ